MKGLRWLLSLAVAFVFLLPLLWMVQASFRLDDEVFRGGMMAFLNGQVWTLDNYADAWRRADMGRAMVTSFLQVAGIVSIGLLFNSMAAFAFARMRFRGKHVLFYLVVILMILPIEVLVVPLFLCVRDLGMLGGYGSTILALILPFSAKAFNIFLLRQHFLLLPRELEDAAVVDGAGPFRIYWSIALPAIRPALATVAVLDVLVHWSDFIWPLVVCTGEETRTIQITLANLFTQPPVLWGDILACSVLATLPVMLLFRFAQRHIVATESGAGIK